MTETQIIVRDNDGIEAPVNARVQSASEPSKLGFVARIDESETGPVVVVAWDNSEGETEDFQTHDHWSVPVHDGSDPAESEPLHNLLTANVAGLIVVPTTFTVSA